MPLSGKLKFIKRRGFTLTELLVALFITLSIFTIGLTLLKGILEARRDTQSRVEGTATARLFFSQFERDFKDAYPGPWSEPYSVFDDPGKSLPIVYSLNPTTKPKLEGDLGDVIEFSMRIESTEFGENLRTVRYYTWISREPIYYTIAQNQIKIPSERVLFRETSDEQPTELTPNPQNPLISDPDLADLNLTGSDRELWLEQKGAEHLFISGVRSLQAEYLRWDKQTKTMDTLDFPDAFDPTNKAQFQNPSNRYDYFLNVRLKIDDPIRPRVVEDEDAFEKLPDHHLNYLSRVFQQMIPIPDALLP